MILSWGICRKILVNRSRRRTRNTKGYEPKGRKDPITRRLSNTFQPSDRKVRGLFHLGRKRIRISTRKMYLIERSRIWKRIGFPSTSSSLVSRPTTMPVRMMTTLMKLLNHRLCSMSESTWSRLVTVGSARFRGPRQDFRAIVHKRFFLLR